MKFLTSFSRQFTTLVIGSIFMLTLLIGVQALQAQTKLSSVTSSTELLEPADQNRIQASPSALTKYTASTGNVYQDNLPIKLKGINWFGFETNDHVVHGLWARNWQSMIIQMKSLGFNAVRLPICPATLQGSSVSTINYSLNPDLNGLNSLQILDKILNELNAQGMYILLDHHNPDCNGISELWYTGSYPESQWLSDLKTLTTRYQNLPYFMGVDLKNEPHDNGGSGASWGTGNLARDWNKAAERAIASLSAVNTRQLFFVEGIGNYQSNCSDSSGFFWGENIMPARCYPLQLTASQSARTVLSPHVYGPDVFGMSYFSDPAFPNNMPAIWDAHFAASSGTGSATLTRVIGEWGGKYGNNGGNALDVTWQNAFVTYLKNKNICNTFYWSWNPNSGDTGGILQDDWQTPWSNKVTMLNNFYSSCQLPKVCAEDGKCR